MSFESTGESLPSPEARPSAEIFEKARAMLGLEESGFEGLKNKIREADGRVFVLVHPFYQTASKGLFQRINPSQENKELQRLGDRIEKFLGSESDSKPPRHSF